MLRTNVTFLALLIAHGLVSSNTGAAEAEQDKVQGVAGVESPQASSRPRITAGPQTGVRTVDELPQLPKHEPICQPGKAAPGPKYLPAPPRKSDPSRPPTAPDTKGDRWAFLVSILVMVLLGKLLQKLLGKSPTISKVAWSPGTQSDKPAAGTVNPVPATTPEGSAATGGSSPAEMSGMPQEQSHWRCFVQFFVSGLATALALVLVVWCSSWIGVEDFGGVCSLIPFALWSVGPLIAFVPMLRSYVRWTEFIEAERPWVDCGTAVPVVGFILAVFTAGFIAIPNMKLGWGAWALFGACLATFTAIYIGLIRAVLLRTGRKGLSPHELAELAARFRIPTGTGSGEPPGKPMRCPHCNADLPATEEIAGREAACPHCHGALAVPPASVPEGVKE